MPPKTMSVAWPSTFGPSTDSVTLTSASDVFVSPGQNALTRLERETGREIWTNRVAQRFLSTDFKYVWAVDRIGQLQVLDYHRGTTLGKYDTSEYVVPVTNDLTDRFLLAANDGQILCLRHRDHRQPVRTKTLVERIVERIVERKEETKEPAKEPEKKDEKKLYQFQSKGPGWKSGPDILSRCPTYDERGWLPAATHGWYSTMQEYDGSTHFLRDGIDIRVLGQLVTRAAGEVVGDY